MRKRWSIRPLDTLFFREGTPFHQGETGTVHPKSQFPPSITILQGAIRTTLAIQQDWSPDSSKKFPPKLGTSECLGDLQLSGPFLQWREEERIELLFPAPLVLVGKKGKDEQWDLTRLLPGEPVDCDLGKGLRLLQKERRIPGHALSVWLTRAGLEAVLQGELPEPKEIWESSQLWKEEIKVGIARNKETRTAEEGQLYTFTHIRPEKELEIVVGTEGLPDDYYPNEWIAIPLGGEGKFASARIEDWTDHSWFPHLPQLTSTKEGKIRFTVSLLTPGYYEDDKIKQVIRKGPQGIPGTCITASIGKILRLGGWDIVKKGPRPVKPLLPAGSTWFFEADEKDLPAIEKLHGRMTGEMSQYGMGQLVIGVWREKEE